MNPLAHALPRSATLRTALSPQECAARLAEITDGSFTFLGTRPMVGSVSAGGMAVRKRINYRNSWQTVLNARFEGQKGLTNIRCRFWMHPFVVVFMAVWFLFAAVALVGLFAAESQLPTYARLTPLAFVLFGVLMLAIGRWVARKEESYLLETVRAAVGGTVIDRDPGFEPVDGAEMERLTAEGPTSRILVFVAIGLLIVVGLSGFAVYLTSGQP